MNKPGNASVLWGLLFAVFLIQADDAFAQGRSRSMVKGGVLQADVNMAGMEYLRNYNKLDASQRQAERARLLAQLERLDKNIDAMQCSNNLHGNIDRIRAQFQASPPDSAYISEPTNLLIPLYAGMMLCTTSGDLVMSNYYLLGNVIGNLDFLYRMAANGYGNLDPEILDHLDRLGLIAPDLLARKEFPGEAVGPLQALLQIAQAHKGKSIMSAQAREEARNRIGQLNKVFLGS